MKRKALMLTALLSCVLCIHGQNVAKNCYRGYVDAGYSIGIGDYEFGRFEVNTSHGYQFNRKPSANPVLQGSAKML